jgi:hypothetical protein
MSGRRGRPPTHPAGTTGADRSHAALARLKAAGGGRKTFDLSAHAIESLQVIRQRAGDRSDRDVIERLLAAELGSVSHHDAKMPVPEPARTPPTHPAAGTWLYSKGGLPQNRSTPEALLAICRMLLTHVDPKVRTRFEARIQLSVDGLATAAPSRLADFDD